MAKKSPGRSDRLEIDGREVPVTNLDKVLYPGNGFSKAQVIDYYIRVSEYLLPHFANRPVTLKRFPDGVPGETFYEKKAPKFAPAWIKTFPVPRRAGGADIPYILINDLATLVWCANVASLELHPFLHCVPEIQQPTSVVFDLDPGEGTDILTCAEVAFLLKDLLGRLGLQASAKVSGSKGLQVYVPLNTPVSYAATQPFARAVADMLTRENPQLVLAEMAKSQRAKKVFIDWSQNSDFKTTIGVYSLRAKRDRPFVSLPIGWEELEAALKSRKTEGLYFEPEGALTRLGRVGDLFAPVLQLKQTLPSSATTLKPTKSQALKRFVVQKHAASHLHYDFRLEMHDALKSWAVPKGVPYEPDQRRLAMAVEDHPTEYLEFEGVIPEGQYGGGTVMVWDIGTYELIEGNYYKGKLQLQLNGKKLKGQWHLVKDRKTDKNWYLLKTGTAMKPLSGKRENASALTGRTMEQIARDKSAQWHSNRTSVPGVDLDQLPRSAMRFVEAMQCELAAELPEGEDWQYELKLDGYRALAIKDQGTATLLSRNNNSLNTKFVSVAEGLNRLEDGIILDGEVVALDEQGRPNFGRLQHLSKNQVLMYYAFDLLAYRARDITGLPLSQRRELLNDVMKSAGDPIRVSAVLKARAEDLIAAVREQGLEGIIAKRADSKYEAGARSGRWVKYKVNQGQELVIGGYKPSGKNHFDNLAVGYYDGDQLIFIAKIKNGFTPALKDEIYERIKPHQTRTCPFGNLPEPKNARRGEALTAEAMKQYRWINPEVVAQIEYTDWTSANHLRHAKFIALRDDKNPRAVVHEIVTPATSPIT